VPVYLAGATPVLLLALSSASAAFNGQSDTVPWVLAAFAVLLFVPAGLLLAVAAFHLSRWPRFERMAHRWWAALHLLGLALLAPLAVFFAATADGDAGVLAWAAASAGLLGSLTLLTALRWWYGPLLSATLSTVLLVTAVATSY
jgi:hypothetical protein